MGYVLNYFVGLAKKAYDSVTSISLCSRSDNAASDEEEPLIMSRQVSLRKLVGNELGFSDGLLSWSESEDAAHYCLLHLGIYLFLAIAGYSFIFEDWKITDSIYFAVVIFTTVGYGDLSPTSDISRVFTIAFAFYGIIILGVFLGMVGEWIIERHEEAKKKRLDNARTKIMEQFSDEDNAKPPTDRNYLGEIKEICVSMAPVIFVLICFGAPIIYLEGWDVIMGIYWMVVTGTTVGFGDYGPTETLTRCVCVLYIPLAVAVMGEFLGRVAGAYIERRNEEIEDRFLERTMTESDLRKMDSDKDGGVSPTEFLSYMLVALQKVEKEDIDEILELFKKLDSSNTGFINKQDLLNQMNLSVRPGIAITATKDGFGVRRSNVSVPDNPEFGSRRSRP